MSSAWNPNTVDYRRSVNTPDFPAPWVINHPEADALFDANVPMHYWKDVAGIATEMTPAEKAAVDASRVEASRDSAVTRMDDLEDIVRAIALTLLDAHNANRTALNAILDGIDAAASLADVKASIGAIANLPIGNGAQLRAQVRAKLGT
jgi:hypothetical protein